MEIDTSVSFGLDRTGREGCSLKLQYEHSEVNVFVTLPELQLLRKVVNASWDERESFKIGECAGSSAFWCCDGGVVTVLIGSDDECWDVGVSMSVKALEVLIEQVSSELLEFDRASSIGVAT